VTIRKERHHFVTDGRGGPIRGAALQPGSSAGTDGGGHQGEEDGVHAGLVAGALGVEPGDDRCGAGR
jgi:hypothetical protein